ncbi:GYF domain-containing protein [Mycena indigotica]|uniref:GYF domain-containing protein n=1 Tax=Mycena indigotica TaxID=2126181 RepID=A0A8H6SYP9_9AGAR|nr:GYF domain-containing protein [Mycena indigotica]KAF7306747.1 GYF domain-containing protein [Mycena indigotica]
MEASEQEQVPVAIVHESDPSQTTDKIVVTEETTPRGPSLSTSTTDDAASTHSMPAVLVTEPDSTLQPPADPLPPASPTRLNADPPNERRNRRSTVEVRASNRLSGFFTNLIHRREPPPRSPIREERPSPANPSRSSSPTPARPATPPPRLPPPTLTELGLAMSAITQDLSPSHFSTPPTSGAFMAPHYLLLCHAQGLDVLPLQNPPVSQPYALVRRVSFKSVVVMEQRGVLVAIAGRRDGVRVYALEEIKKAVEWRMEVEVRRERERQRREAVKKLGGIAHVESDIRDSSEKQRKASLSTPPPGEPVARGKLPRKGSQTSIPAVAAPPPSPSPTPPAPLIPRTPTTRRIKNKPPPVPPVPIPEPSGRPPPVFNSHRNGFTFSPHYPTAPSVSGWLCVKCACGSTYGPALNDDWGDGSSDDEAINVVAAGASGSQALDERTSVRLSANLSIQPGSNDIATVSSSRRGSRPANLDLSLSIPTASSQIPPSEPSPAPTLLTLRQALSQSPSGGTRRQLENDPDTPFFGEFEEEEEEIEGHISLAEALFESRLPDLPPAGTRQPQQPILLSGPAEEEPSSPRTSEHSTPHTTHSEPRPNRRRRWSVLISNALVPSSSEIPPVVERSPGSMARSQSYRSNQSLASTTHQPTRPSTASTSPATLISTTPQDGSTPTPSTSSRSSRFIPRIISNAFHGRRADERPPLPALKTTTDVDIRRTGMTPTTSHMPPPKLEYVKLPGTKGALTIKAVETAKKSFLAILCGENGEKVELFAGTYRTALGLSRTFILPDSPRLLELQLQGDDLVEVFLVFGQNVFGLEPATVRVREVRIGRAERRAARRRAREVRAGEAADADNAGDEDTQVTVNIGVSVSVGSTVVATGTGADASQPGTPPLIAGDHPDQPEPGSDVNNETANEPTTSISHAEELLALATARMGPYTTFQQLSFAPKFPLAAIADEYIIPPTYPNFIDYRNEYEPEASGSNTADLTQVQFTPPGLPVPQATAPSRWYYRDPKNTIHGPWKASLMQAWYKDGLLPPDLPVRREEDEDYMLLKDLRLQSVDPSHPFRTPPPPAPSTSASTTEIQKPLLSPISLLAQPRHFGPPALFFSTRGGHSTAIVDARGRSVLKGRFLWSDDGEAEDTKVAFTRMGDVRRLEAFDIKGDRAVLVAMRQGGLEAVDLGDALLKPADESRTVLPEFNPPPSNINRRGPFVWKMGTPVGTAATVLSTKSKSGFGHHIASKKPSSASKSPVGRTEFSIGDTEPEIVDEVLFLGRKEDELYLCERNAGSFRILRLSPS